MGSLTFANVDRLCASVDITQAPIQVDLSTVDFFEPFGLIYLGMFLRHYNTCGVSFEVVPPDNSEAREYLARQHFWERFNFDPTTLPATLLHRITADTSPNDIVDIERRPGIAEEYVASLSHHEAAALAFQPKITAKPSGGGTGLWDVRNAVRQLGGRMRLATGDGYVQDWRGQMRMGQMAFELPGVQVEISIPLRA